MGNCDGLNYEIQIRERFSEFSLKILVLSDNFPKMKSGWI